MEISYVLESDSFHADPREEDEESDLFINPGIFAHQLANFLRQGLEAQGYRVADVIVEDWGNWVEIDHDGGYFLAVGCANLDDHEHRLFIEPDKPVIRRWFKKVDVSEDRKRLGIAVEKVLNDAPEIKNWRLGD